MSQLLVKALSLADSRVAETSERHRKKWGQFFSPKDIAEFMAELLIPHPNGAPIRLLDPGAGSGILGLAASQRLLQLGAPSVELIAIEAEPAMAQALLDTAPEIARLTNGRLHLTVIEDDFLLLGQPELFQAAIPPVDLVIANPPYFKMSPSLSRGGDAPNIYARFMHVASRLLAPTGRMCFIVPRSFASGFYFRRFRKQLHSTLTLERVHLFSSRSEAFRDQRVLQENIVVLYSKEPSDPLPTVTVSTSNGSVDLKNCTDLNLPRSLVLDPGDPRSVLHLPTSEADLDLMALLHQWDTRLVDYDLKISTGPVVPFRAVDYLLSGKPDIPGIPLLWMHHVHAGSVRWPIGPSFTKQEFIKPNAGTNLLVPNKTYVLLRRFSAKEEPRRLTAAVLEAGKLPGSHVGLENHLNFIHRPGGDLDLHEAHGLSALLNSRVFDDYFRISNGNTQVSATEIRAMPLPPPEMTIAIGERMAAGPVDEHERIVNEVLSVEDPRGEGDTQGSRNAPKAAKRQRGVHATRVRGRAA